MHYGFQRRSFRQLVAPPSRLNEQAFVAELFQDPLELAAAAMESLQGVIDRGDGMVRLDLPKEKQNFLLLTFGGFSTAGVTETNKNCICASSSAGQSTALLRRVSDVRIVSGRPFFQSLLAWSD